MLLALPAPSTFRKDRPANVRPHLEMIMQWFPMVRPAKSLLILFSLALGCIASAQSVQFSGTQSNVVSYMGIVILSSQYSFYTEGVAVDVNGNVYIAHGCYTSPNTPSGPADCTVWKETPSGGGYTQTSIAIGYSSNPDSIPTPGQVAVDSQGNLYVTDNHYLTAGNPNRVWKETPSAGGYTASVVASLPSGSLAFGVTVDASGNVYWTDAVNGNVWEETPSGAAYIETLFASGLGYPDGVNVDSLGNINIAEAGASSPTVIPPVVLKETPSGGSYTQSTVGTGLTSPFGVAADAFGNVYIADDGTHYLYKESPSAGTYIQSTVPIFTPGSTFFTSSGSQVTVDSGGNIYMADTPNQRVIKESAGAGKFGSVNVGTAASTPISVIFTFNEGETLGSTAVLTQGTNTLDFIDAGTGSCTATTFYYAGYICAVNVNFTPTAAGTRYGAVQLLDGSGNVFATGYVQGTGVAPQVNFLPGTQSVVSSTALSSPNGFGVDGTGNIYIADSGNDRVLKEAHSVGGYTQTIVASGSSPYSLSDPFAVAIDGAGDVYIYDAGLQEVFKETPSAGSYTQSVVTSGLVSGGDPVWIAVDGSGSVYILSYSSGVVLKETPSGATYTQSVLPSSTLSNPSGIAVDGSGNFYVADTGNHRVLKETLSGSTYAESTIGSGLVLPFAVSVDGLGNVYISDQSNKTMYKETLSAGSYTQSVIPSIGLSSAGLGFGIAADSSGNVYILDTSAGQVLKEDFAAPPSLSFALTAVGSTSSNSPQTVALENYGNAPLTFEIPGSGNNPSISANFTLNSIEVSTCPLVGSGSSNAGILEAGASCLLPISFAPEASGSIAGSLSVTDNALNAVGPNYAQQSIQLSGTAFVSGVPAQLTSPAPSTLLAGPNISFSWTPLIGATAYELWIGSTGAGSNNLYSSGSMTLSSYTAANLPTNGETVYVRLLTSYSGAWKYADYTYTAATRGVLSTPAPGSVLGGPNVTFSWTPATGTEATGYRLYLGSTGVGSNNLYSSALLTGTSFSALSLPTNGETIYARLITSYNGTLVYSDYTYTTDTQAEMTAPTPSGLLPGPTVKFTWSTSVGATGYELWIGTTGIGSNNLYNSLNQKVTSITVPNLPSNGAAVYVRLLTDFNGTWTSIDYSYTSVTQPAMTSPWPSSTLIGPKITFNWAGAVGATAYQVYLGSTGVGSNNLYNSGSLTGTSFTAANLPTNGATVYARLLTNFNGTFAYTDYTYTADTHAVMTSPAPGSVLPGPKTSFTWTTAAGATAYEIYLGSTGIGSSNLFNSGSLTGTTYTASNLPTNGETIYARVLTNFAGTWSYVDYTYTAATDAQLASPVPGSTLAGTTQTFTIAPATGTEASAYELYLGSTGIGSSNLYSSGQTTTISFSVKNLPNNGETIYARVLTNFGGTWGYVDYTYVAQ
jgi:sugar lactone lactonase YvrE